MDAVLPARVLFAVTVGFHFIFPPLTIGMAWLMVWFYGRYNKTRDETYARLARFWTRLFAISFAVGVATGIVMEFQFGTNWADYSRYVGDIFGAPLAAEGIFAFFLESTFVGALLFGFNRLSPRALWFASLMVALGATLSAFWIIVANSWMQTPAGYHLVGGRAELTDFWAAVFNPSTVPRYLHTVVACMITGSFFVMGVSAWYLRKGVHLEIARRSLKASLVVGFVFSVLQLPLGHYHAVQVTHTQPEKLAAFEGLFETQRGAPLLLFGIPDAQARTVHAAIRVPGLLSFLTSGDFDAEVQGLNDFPREEWPPLLLTFTSFHLMFVLGMFFIGLTALGMFLLWRNKLFGNRLFLGLAMVSIPLPFVANELGWIAAEVGRQPWIVYRLVKTADAISRAVPGEQVLFSLVLFSVIYLLLGALWLFLLRRRIVEGPPGDGGGS